MTLRPYIGSLGLAGCFSTQTYKHLSHGIAPDEEVFADTRLDTPSMSAHIDAAVARLRREAVA